MGSYYDGFGEPHGRGLRMDAFVAWPLTASSRISSTTIHTSLWLQDYKAISTCGSAAHPGLQKSKFGQ